MWIYSKHAFFSIVEHRDDPTILIVRARVKGDIEKYWSNTTVSKTPDADYLYRAHLSRAEVAQVVREIVLDINYDNFKSHISDKRRGRWYQRVWEAMYSMQHSLGEKTG